MQVLILPIFENINKFQKAHDEIKNVHKIKLCQDGTKQASIDGVWLWGVDEKNSFSKEARANKKIWINKNTLQEVKPNSENSIEVFDWVSVDDVEFKIHSDSKITLADIEAQKNKSHIDFGNGMSSPVIINGKPCTIIVLEQGEIIEDNKLNKIADSIKNA